MVARALVVVLNAFLVFLSSCSKLEPGPAPLKTSLQPTKLERADSKRVIYPFSVIPGGVDTAEDVMDSIKRDPLVGQHYAQVRPAELRRAVLKEDRMGYVSYRAANKIYWTAKPVKLKKGELVLTGGGATVRGRCGNQVSEEPREPIQPAEVEPTESELDTPVEPPRIAEYFSTVPGTVLSNLPLADFPSDTASPQTRQPGEEWAQLGRGGYGGGFGGGSGMPASGSAQPSNEVFHSPGGDPPSNPPERPQGLPPPRVFIPPPLTPPFYPPPNPPGPPGTPPTYVPPTSGPPSGSPPPNSPPPPVGWPPPGSPSPPGSPPPPLGPPGAPPVPPFGPPPGSPVPPSVPPMESVPETATYLLTGIGLIAVAVVGRKIRPLG